MPPERMPWIKIEVPMVTHPKLADLPNDSARWGWLFLLCRAKQAKPQGRFASVGQLREEAGRFARYIADWTRVGLLDGPDGDGGISVHDWPKHQFDPTNADRQAAHRNGKSNGDSNGNRNGDSRARALGDRRQETSPSDEGETRAVMHPIEKAARKLLNGGGSESQIETILGLGEQVGETKALKVLESWEQSAVRDRFGRAMAELVDLANRKKGGRLKAVPPTTSYDSHMKSDDDDDEVGAA